MRRKKKQKAGGAPASQGEAFVAIAEEGGDSALKLVGDIMERNALALDALNANLLEDEKQEHNMTRHELNATRYRLADLQERLAWLMGGDIPKSLRDEVEAIISDEVSEMELRVL